MKTTRLLFSVSLLALFSSCMQDEPFKLGYRGYAPVSDNDGWVLSTPGLEGMDSSYLDMAFRLVSDEDRYMMARGMVVVRHGRIVAESYPHDPADRLRILNLQSITKSFTSVCMGIALKKGLVDSVGQRLYEFYPDNFDEQVPKRSITLRDAMTMRAGLEFDNGEHTLELYQETGSSVRYVLTHPLLYAPGVMFRYNDGAPQLVAGAIERRAGMPLDAFAEEYLFRPLGLRNWKWERAKDGVAFGAFGLYLTARDAAKFGRLLLQNGRWNGVPLVDSTYLQEATSPLVNADSHGTPYGYYFWIYPAYGGYAAIGHGGQYIMVVPAKDLVVVYTAWPYTDGTYFDNFNQVMDLILKSCR